MKYLLTTLLFIALVISSAMAKPTPNAFKVIFKTTQGEFVVAVDKANAPLGVERFQQLVSENYFKDAMFFRVVKGFVVQFGIAALPKVSARWKEATLKDDPVKLSNVEGTITFATAGPNTRTAQLFINLGNNQRLDSMGFAPFGKVEKGMDVVKKLYAEYGEAPTPEQDQIYAEGNAFLNKKYPKLDRILSATIMKP